MCLRPAAERRRGDDRGGRESGRNGRPNWTEKGPRGNERCREYKSLVLEDGGQGALAGQTVADESRRPIVRGSVMHQTRRCATAAVSKAWRGSYPSTGTARLKCDGRGMSQDGNRRPPCCRKGPGATRRSRRPIGKCRRWGWYEGPVLEWRRPGGTGSAEMNQGSCADLSTPSRYGDVKLRGEATARLRIREVKEADQDVACDGKVRTRLREVTSAF